MTHPYSTLILGVFPLNHTANVGVSYKTTRKLSIAKMTDCMMHPIYMSALKIFGSP